MNERFVISDIAKVAKKLQTTKYFRNFFATRVLF